MLVNEVMRRIDFKVGTLDDISGRAVNQIVSNRIKIDELNSQLRNYANITKGIQDVYSFPLDTNKPFIAAPSLALRSQAYYFAYVLSNKTIFPIDFKGAADVLPKFRYNPVQGVTNWIMPWGAGSNGQYLSFFPMKNASAATTTTNGAVTPTATTITVASTASFVANHGRFTLDSEKILYTYTDATHFYGCTRGVEMTTAAAHTTSATITENNVILFYSRLPVAIEVTDDDEIPTDVRNREIEVVEEHMEGIIKAVAYNLLIKLDPERAGIYKLDYEDLYRQYSMDIRKGYARNRQGSGIRQPNGWESGVPYSSNLQY